MMHGQKNVKLKAGCDIKLFLENTEMENCESCNLKVKVQL